MSTDVNHAATGGPADAAAVTRSQRRKAAVASTIGTTIEW